MGHTIELFLSEGRHLRSIVLSVCRRFFDFVFVIAVGARWALEQWRREDSER